MVWKLNIEGVGVLEGEELEKYLEEKVIRNDGAVYILYPKVEGGYARIRLTKHLVERLGFDNENWFEMVLVFPDGKELFLRRVRYWFDVPYNLGKMVFTDRFVRVYGEGKDPIGEITGEKIFEYLDRGKKVKEVYDKSKLRRNFKVFEKYDWAYLFRGNHERYSGAFRYIIWDKKLAKEVVERLRKLGYEDLISDDVDL